jgi:hypothetical protein
MWQIVESGDLFVVPEVKYKLICLGQPLLQFFILRESEYLFVRGYKFGIYIRVY